MFPNRLIIDINQAFIYAVKRTDVRVFISVLIGLLVKLSAAPKKLVFGKTIKLLKLSFECVIIDDGLKIQ